VIRAEVQVGFRKWIIPHVGHMCLDAILQAVLNERQARRKIRRIEIDRPLESAADFAGKGRLTKSHGPQRLRAVGAAEPVLILGILGRERGRALEPERGPVLVAAEETDLAEGESGERWPLVRI